MSAFPDYTQIETLFHKAFYKMNDLYTRCFQPKSKYDRPNLGAQESSDLIYELLSGDNPCMIARFGSVELFCVSNYLGIQKGTKNALGFIRGYAEPWWWAPERISAMQNNAGFFPINEKSVTEFCELMLNDSLQLDLLASWLEKELNLENILKSTPRVFLPYLEPWYAERPWTQALAGKKVVVVHPFAQLIEKQYNSYRAQLFHNPNLLPPFELRTVKAVQSIGGGNDSGFKTWFDALEWMKSETDKEYYDVALIGCGAYGFPLAAHIKRSGKKAVHMGGVLQLLFGIKGNRWEDPMYGVREWGLPESYYNQLFNEYWVKPGAAFTPKNAANVENACYW